MSHCPKYPKQDPGMILTDQRLDIHTSWSSMRYERLYTGPSLHGSLPVTVNPQGQPSWKRLRRQKRCPCFVSSGDGTTWIPKQKTHPRWVSPLPRQGMLDHTSGRSGAHRLSASTRVFIASFGCDLLLQAPVALASTSRTFLP